jgi:hypothetical protein
MHPRISELVAFIEAQREQLRATVASIPETKYAAPPANGGWSILGVLEHVAITEARITKGFQREVSAARAAGASLETDDAPILKNLDVKMFLDRTRRIEAPPPVHPKLEMDLAAAWDALDRSRAGMHQAIADADGLALGALSMPHPFFGPMDLYTWIALVGAHDARHADQIREIGSSLGDAD